MTAHRGKADLHLIQTRPALIPQEPRHSVLIEMHHPAFKRGYQAGRAWYFRREVGPLTDKQLVECLETAAQEGLFSEDDESTRYYIIGQFIGQMSGSVIPRQPNEEDEALCQERLLAHITAIYGECEQTDRLKATITTLWQAQDELAAKLDNDIYKRVLCRDASLHVYR
jgi:hypothetical protein